MNSTWAFHLEETHFANEWETGGVFFPSFYGEIQYGNDTFGSKNSTALIKIGTAIGPRIWFNEEYGTNLSSGPVTVANNQYSGAMNFGIVSCVLGKEVVVERKKN